MFSRFTAALTVLLAGLGLCAATTAPKKPKPKAVKAVTKPASTKKTVKRASARSARARTQANPSPERYKEIQEALAAKGYLPKDQATGQWNDASADALKRFQADQKIESTGRINSLSLIALGLGPKHESAQTGIGASSPRPAEPAP